MSGTAVFLSEMSGGWMSLMAKGEKGLAAKALQTAAVVAVFLGLAVNQARSPAGTYPGRVWAYEGATLDVNTIDVEPLPSIVKGPYLLWPTRYSVTVAWETDLAADSRIGYGLDSPSEFATEDSTPVTLHRMAVSGLDPGTTYRYQVASEGTLGPVSTFVTAPAKDASFRFVVYGDTRSYPDKHAAVIESIIHSRPVIVFHTGDLVGTGRDYPNWQTDFFGPAYGLMQSTPVVPVMGNHEYFGTGPLWFSLFFDLPSDEGWWAMTYGGIRFIGLNTNLDYTPGSEQYEWLLAEVQSSAFTQALWRIVICHRPPYTCTTVYKDDPAAVAYLVPLFEQAGVQLVFSAHSHAYERYSQRGITYIVTAGGGAPFYAVVDDTAPPIRQFGVNVYHHCVIDVNVPDQVLCLNATDTDGQVFDTVEVPCAPMAYLEPE